MFQSLALRTEVLAGTGLTTFDDRGDHVVKRTPSMPDFWDGNAVILRDQGLGVSEGLTRFAAAFPDASHISLCWDGPTPMGAQLTDTDLEPDISHVLKLDAPMAKAPHVPNIQFRPFLRPEDWEQSLDLALEIGVEEGFDPTPHRPYLHRRIAGRRQQVDAGLGLWFGGFDGDLLVGQLGLFLDQTLARYQDVETRKGHRRRGIARRLLSMAHLWQLDRAPDATLVILVDPDSAAERLYRRVGFQRVETLVALGRAGY